MQWKSFADFRAMQSPGYALSMQKMQAQWRASVELENQRFANQIEMQNRANAQQWELARYKEEMSLSTERVRGENRLKELDRDLENKIKYLGAEQVVQNTMRILDEMSKNLDFMRNGLTEILKKKHEGQQAIIQFLLNEKAAQGAHWREIERRKAEIEHTERIRQIDELAKRAIAYGEVVAASAGEEAATRAINSIVARWEGSNS